MRIDPPWSPPMAISTSPATTTAALPDDDVKFFLETMVGSVAAYHAIEAMADPMPPVKYPRTPGYRPQGAENKYNAWYYKSEV